MCPRRINTGCQQHRKTPKGYPSPVSITSENRIWARTSLKRTYVSQGNPNLIDRRIWKSQVSVFINGLEVSVLSLSTSSSMACVSCPKVHRFHLRRWSSLPAGQLAGVGWCRPSWWSLPPCSSEGLLGVSMMRWYTSTVNVPNILPQEPSLIIYPSKVLNRLSRQTSA